MGSQDSSATSLEYDLPRLRACATLLEQAQHCPADRGAGDPVADIDAIIEQATRYAAQATASGLIDTAQAAVAVARPVDPAIRPYWTGTALITRMTRDCSAGTDGYPLDVARHAAVTQQVARLDMGGCARSLHLLAASCVLLASAIDPTIAPGAVSLSRTPSPVHVDQLESLIADSVLQVRGTDWQSPLEPVQPTDDGDNEPAEAAALVSLSCVVMGLDWAWPVSRLVYFAGELLRDMHPEVSMSPIIQDAALVLATSGLGSDGTLQSGEAHGRLTNQVASLPEVVHHHLAGQPSSTTTYTLTEVLRHVLVIAWCARHGRVSQGRVAPRWTQATA